MLSLEKGNVIMQSRQVGLVAIVFAGVLAGGAGAAENLCFNGTFDHSPDPLEGWTTDYAWPKNKNYVDNRDRVSVLPLEGGRASVVRIVAAGDAGAKLDSKPIPFEMGYRYTCKFKMKTKGDGPLRIYFAGHKWKPGIRPHDDPEMGELRTIYKSKAYTQSHSSWKTVTFELPGIKKMSKTAYNTMKYLRFVTLYAWTSRELFIDDVQITRVKDPKLEL